MRFSDQRWAVALIFAILLALPAISDVHAEQATLPTDPPAEPSGAAKPAIHESADPQGSDRSDEPDADIERITVLGFPQRLASYDVRDQSTATRIDLPIKDTPVSIQVVPRAVIDSQAGIVLEDAIRNVSGVAPADRRWQARGNTKFIVRGFETRSVYVDGMPTTATGTVDVQNTETVEVLKGPASILYGLVEPGGLINLVTKKPDWSDSYTLRQQFGSFDLFRTTFDVNTPVNERVAIRLNGTYNNSGSFRDFITNKAFSIAPSLAWRPTDATEIIFQGSFSQSRTPLDYGLAFSSTGEPVAPISTYLGSPAARPAEITDAYARYMLTHQFTENWSFRSVFDYHYFRNDNLMLLPISPTVPKGTIPEFPDQYTLIERYNARDTDVNVYQSVNDTQVDFDLGPTQHKVLVGLDLRRSQWTDTARVDYNTLLVQPIVNPQYQPLPEFDWQESQNGNQQDWLGIYLQDAIALLPSERLRVLLGGRFDAVKTKGLKSTEGRSSDQAFTGRAGLLFQVLEGLGAYGSVSQSFQPVTAGLTTREGVPLKPETGLQYEVGAKAEFAGGALATLALYDLTKDNVPVQDPLFPDFWQNGGKIRSRGIEFDIRGEILEGWNLIASYAYTKSKVLASGILTVGDPLRGVPPHSGSIWSTYRFDSATFLDGLSLGAGVFASAARPGNNFLPKFTLARFLQVDFVGSYTFEVADTVWVDLQLNVRNALDRINYASSRSTASVEPATPLAFIGSIAFRY